MKNLYLAGAALLLVTALVLLQGGSGEESGPGEVPAGGATDTPGSSVAALEEGLITSPGEMGSRRIDLAPGKAGSAEALGTVLEGVVRVVDGGPLDPDIQVLAHDREGGYGSLMGRTPLASTGVDEDGHFTLELAEGTEEAWLLVRGRYLYSRSARRSVVGEEIELISARGARLVGRIESPGEQPLGDALLELRTDIGRGRGTSVATAGQNPTALRAEVAPAADGTFEIRALPVEHDYSLVFSHPRLATVRLEVGALAPGEDRFLELMAREGGHLSGRVTDGSGRPVEGAEVSANLPARFFGLDLSSVREGASDADGRFRLEHVPEGKILVRAEGDGFLPSDTAEVEVDDGGEHAGIELVLDPGGAIEGRVRWPDGEPAPNVPVRLLFDPAFMGGPEALGSLRGASGSATTDESGLFRISGLGRGPFSISATAEKNVGGVTVEHRAFLDGVRPGSTGLQLELSAPVGLTGVVVDGSGEPVTTMQIFARRDTGGGGMSVPTTRPRIEDFEDEQGRFRLDDVRPGTWRIWVNGPSHLSTEPTLVEVGAETAEVRVVAQKAARASGRVVDPGGVPVAGAQVVEGAGGLNLAALTEGGPPPISDETTLDGEFDLGPLPAGPGSITAIHQEFASSSAMALELLPGEHRSGLLLSLTLGGAVEGVVYQKSGEPAEGRLVTVMSSNVMSGGFTQEVAITDGAGGFRVEGLTPGTYQVISMDTGGDMTDESGDLDVGAMVGGMETEIAEVVEGETVYVQLGAPPADPVGVTGRVSLAGEGVSGALVVFNRLGAPLMAGMETTSTDELGEYEVQLPEPGDYLVTVQRVDTPGRQQTIEFEVRAGASPSERHDFELPLGRISGILLDGSGDPAAGERVTLVPDGPARSDRLWSQYSELVSGEDGRFEITGLREGVYRVSAGGQFLGSGSGRGRVTRSGLRLEQGAAIDSLELVLPEAGSLLVRVRDAEGLPVTGASILLRDAEGRALEPLSFNATDGAGEARISGLAPGEVTVMARTPESASTESGPVTVREGESELVELELGPGVVLLVTMQEREGDREPISAEVTVTDEKGREMTGMLGMSDLNALYSNAGLSPNEHRVGPIPPGRYLVEARSGKLSARKSVTIRGHEGERKLTLRLR